MRQRSATELSLGDRMRLSVLAADRSRRAALARALNSPLLRWRYGSPAVDQLLIVPQDLRPSDPSFWREVQLGQFGLAGALADLGGRSPFEFAPPTKAWSRSLHGFGWLRHLQAADSDAAREMARRLAIEWSIRHRGGSGVAFEPMVLGRRIISWLSHATLLLEGADRATYDALMESLGRQLVVLSGAWRDASEGMPRLVALMALTLADLCIAGRDRRLEHDARLFAGELSRQIRKDGCHVSRHPGIGVELMLDLLPLRQCFTARDRTPPGSLVTVTGRMIAMLRHMRMGDGHIARFNGMGIPSPAALATVIAYDEDQALPPARLLASRYQRMERGGTIVIVDAGAAPPLMVSGEAHAGCLSFELSAGPRLLVVNGGAPGASDKDWRAVSRATASHNTLCLGERSSARLVRHAQLEELIGGMPIRGPDRVDAAIAAQADGAVALRASHDGYLADFGLLHHRSLALDATGARLTGIDRLAPPKGHLRLKRDVPFSIHFHFHPEVAVDAVEGGNTVTFANGTEFWRLIAEGAALSVEESIHFADSAGPRESLQLVLRGATFGESEVRWALERVA